MFKYVERRDEIETKTFGYSLQLIYQYFRACTKNNTFLILYFDHNLKKIIKNNLKIKLFYQIQLGLEYSL